MSAPAAPDGDRRDGGRRGGAPASRVRGSMVPEAEFRSYYGRPIIKEPAWTWEVPWYFFAGGLAGASASLGLGARLAGNHRLARAGPSSPAATSAARPSLGKMPSRSLTTAPTAAGPMAASTQLPTLSGEVTLNMRSM